MYYNVKNETFTSLMTKPISSLFIKPESREGLFTPLFVMAGGGILYDPLIIVLNIVM